MPDWKKYLFAGNRARDKTIELVVCPALGEERARQNHNTEAAVGKAIVYFPTKAVTNA